MTQLEDRPKVYVLSPESIDLPTDAHFAVLADGSECLFDVTEFGVIELATEKWGETHRLMRAQPGHQQAYAALETWVRENSGKRVIKDAHSLLQARGEDHLCVSCTHSPVCTIAGAIGVAMVVTVSGCDQFSPPVPAELMQALRGAYESGD